MKLAVAALVVGMALGGAMVGVIQQSRIDREVAAHLQTQQEYAAAALAAESKARLEEERRNQAIREVQKHAREEIDIARRDADSAAATANRLRAEVARLRQRSAPVDTAIAGGSQAGSDPLDLLADLFSRADDRAGELAAHLDRSRIAGLACERAYDSLSR